MPKIITIHGPMAAGKSTLTQLLREKFPSYSYVDRPFIKRGLKPAGKKNALKISKEASYLIIKRLVELRQDIIVQEVNPGNIGKHLGATFLKDNGYGVIPFFIKCSVDKAVERDKLRIKHTRSGRVREIHENYVQPAANEIVIDTEEHSIQECFDLMLRHIS